MIVFYILKALVLHQAVEEGLARAVLTAMEDTKAEEVNFQFL